MNIKGGEEEGEWSKCIIYTPGVPWAAIDKVFVGDMQR